MALRDIKLTGALNWGVTYSTEEGDMVSVGFDSERQALAAADQYEEEGKLNVQVAH